MNIGQGISAVGTGIAETIGGTGKAIDFTLRTTGGAVVYTICAGGTIIKKASGAAMIGLGYALTAVGTPITIGSGLLAIGPCSSATNGLKMSDMLFNIISPTARMVEASTCPTLISTAVGVGALTFSSFVMAKVGERMFSN